MKRGLDLNTSKNHHLPPAQGGGGAGGGAGAGAGGQTRISTPYDHSDTSESDNDDWNGGCLGGWISSLMGGGSSGSSSSGESGLLTKTKATNNTTDDPTILVAQELNKLSLQEREVVYEDLHGVSMVEDESNLKVVRKCLADMKLELEEKIPKSKKVAYTIAMEEMGTIGYEFCMDPYTHLMFLRADRWNPQKAAKRFVGWLDWKLELFGRDVLCHRHVTMDKLEFNTRTELQTGRQQILSQRDTRGRTIIFDRVDHNEENFGSIKSMEQYFWYTMMSAVEDDIVAQQMGIVYILYTVNSTLSFNKAQYRKLMWNCSSMLSMLPIRINSVHYCFNNPKLGPVIKLIQTGVGSHIRARFRSHEGNHTEVQYSLMTYGIPVDALPVMNDGTVKLTNHSKWYKRRKVRDAAFSNRVGGGRKQDFYGIDLPGRFDVLLGKGKPIQESPGNRRLQELVQTYYEEYDAAESGEKKSIAERIVKMIQDPSLSLSCPSPPPANVSSSSSIAGGGNPNATSNDSISTSINRGYAGGHQFLKRRKDGWWEPVPDKVAIQKVCYSFRNLRLSMVASSASGNNGNSGTAAVATKRFKIDETQEEEMDWEKHP